MVHTHPYSQKLLLGVCKLTFSMFQLLRHFKSLPSSFAPFYIVYLRFYVFPKADYIILSSVLGSVVVH